ncbi:MAG: hypothetical protein AAB480_02785 [Patescibacteria group bacterium]
MNTILISYDLNGHEESPAYKKLIDRIKEYPTWAKPLESFWVVKTKSTATGVRDTLKTLIDDNDELLTIDVTSRDWASRGLSTKVTDWLKTNM